MGALCGQELGHALVNRREIVFGQIAKGDASLVSDDHDGNPCLIQASNRRSRARQEAEVVGLVDKCRLVIDDAVAVEECCSPSGRWRGAVPRVQGR
jgi:hypothetical protein